MKRRLFRSSIVAALSAGVLLGLVGSAFAYSNDFNTLGDTTDWNDTSGTITQRPSGSPTRPMPTASPAMAPTPDWIGERAPSTILKGASDRA